MRNGVGFYIMNIGGVRVETNGPLNQYHGNFFHLIFLIYSVVDPGISEPVGFVPGTTAGA